ncbi:MULTISPECIES: RICIN domain-containing protein [Pirellulaceae]|uniref:RICIN domain-containing protein n=1 Tax=Pirellulaceae TaxID=2691357 RepID=UPI0011B0EE95|nr:MULTISPECIES: RICIN domain-containing protein [Pirellulaceae]
MNATVLFFILFSLYCTANAEEFVIVQDKVDHAFEHREEARELGGKKEWTEKIAKSGWTLYDYTVHIISKRGPGTSANYSVSDDVIVVDGQTGYEHLTGEGGNYKAVVHAVFIKPYKTAQVNVSSFSGKLSLTGSTEDEDEFAEMSKSIMNALAANISADKIATVTDTALDANGGNGNLYLNDSPDKNNANHLWKTKKVGQYNMILSKIEGKALDANGGTGNLYLNDSPDQGNANHLWRLKKVGNNFMIISKVANKALDSNSGGAGDPYLHENPESNNRNHLWKFVDASDGFKIIQPVHRKYE